MLCAYVNPNILNYPSLLALLTISLSSTSVTLILFCK